MKPPPQNDPPFGAEPGARETLAAVVAIATSYVFFLIFAQFAFVKILQNSGFEAATTRLAMAFMGVGGVVSSLVSGRRFSANPHGLRRGLIVGFGSCALTAAGALFLSSPAALCTLSALVGVSLGILTVHLAGGMRQLLPTRRRGFWVGAGTGAGYFVCNIPSLFAGSTTIQTVAAIGCCVLGVLASFSIAAPPHPAKFFESGGKDDAFASLVVMFLALVWLDSAAFYIIQATPALNRFGWGNVSLEWQNAFIHLVAALVSGLLLDLGLLRWILCGAFGCFALAAMCLTGKVGGMWLTHWFYATGVSLYSTALVLAPSAMGRCKQLEGSAGAGMDPVESSVKVASRAAKLYAVAGWLGSALGIGMAQDLHQIPGWFVLISGAAVLGCAVYPYIRRTARASRHARLGVFAGLLLPGCVLFAKPAEALANPVQNFEADAKNGREVYISEGCMSCHSQFVRKGTQDEQWWGPWQDPKIILATRPPLIGNRRNGPDLLNIGNRRSMDWNRMHLIEPRDLSPASRMPSYRHLFVPGDPRGPALLEYLALLGTDSFEERNQTIAHWRIAPEAKPVAPDLRAVLYQRHCAQCHGTEGRGDGRLAPQLTHSNPPRNLAAGEWLFYARQTADPSQELARTIKFGIPGTSMPGHELLTDSELLGLAAHVQSLKQP